MTENYLEHYRILGVPPGASWEQLRLAYKKLVNAWHPDRFQQDHRQKNLAEKKIKEITQSYKELAEYYKKFGVLPLPMEEEVSPAVPIIIKDSSPVEVPEPTRVTPPAEAPARWMSRWHRRLAVAAGLLGAIYFIWQIISWKPQENPRADEEHTDPATHSLERNPLATSPAGKQFAIGSSLGEVYAIQGVPTKTENDVWYYGDSKVYFVEGKVQRWDESIDNPLRVRIVPGTENTHAHFFGRGSTKEEVLAAQGMPDRDAGSVWDYGLSRVYFEKERVTGWQESLLNPLRVRR